MSNLADSFLDLSEPWRTSERCRWIYLGWIGRMPESKLGALSVFGCMSQPYEWNQRLKLACCLELDRRESLS